MRRIPDAADGRAVAREYVGGELRLRRGEWPGIADFGRAAPESDDDVVHGERTHRHAGDVTGLENVEIQVMDVIDAGAGGTVFTSQGYAATVMAGSAPRDRIAPARRTG